MKSRFMSFLIVAILISTSFIQIVNAADSPVEHCFGFVHPTITYYSAYRKSFFTIDAQDSYNNAAVPVHNSLSSHGYYNSYSYYDNPASPIRNSIGSDAVFFIFSHAGPGRMCCVDSNSTTANVTLLTANFTSDSQAYSLQTEYQNTTNQLKKVKFAYFGGCDTANTDTEYSYGNLLDRSYALGVDCSLGFSAETNYDTGWYFAKRVIIYYGMDSNNTIGACASSSKRDTFSNFGYYGGIDSYVLRGNSSIKLQPASYGVQ